jgi:4-hydroxy-tetrahydrodipicolinate reductase
MKIAIVGFGKMGHAVGDLARSQGHEIAAQIDLGQLSQGAVRGADVAIEFTQPDAAAGNLIQLAGWKVPAVCGTTGWYGRLPEVRKAVEAAQTALVFAPNFSLGVQLLFRAARELGRGLKERPELDAYLVETHHRGKKDAPSGTASGLREALRGVDPLHDYPITSIRAGQVPGTHELHVGGPGESLLLQHTAHDRSVFAAGALIAARWLVDGKRRGVFTLEQVLFGDGR